MTLRFALLALVIGACAPRAGSATEDQGQGAALFLFQETSTLRSSCDEIPPPSGKHGAVYTIVSGIEFALHRKDQLTLARKDVSELTVHSRSAMVLISGAQADSYSVELCASAGKVLGPDAQPILDSIRLARTGNTLSVAGPEKYDPDRPSRAELSINAPEELPVTVNGTYSYVEVRGINAPVNVRTSNARVRILRTSGKVDANATGMGIIDFAANQGDVRLNADTELNLKLTAPVFNGSLSGSATQAVRVVLPDDFNTPFEAEVHKPSDFVCRAEFCKQIKHLHLKDKELFQFGPPNAALRFVSSHGQVIVDSVERLQQAETDFRRKAEKQRAEMARQAEHINQIAGSIHTEAQAHEFINSLWKVFAPHVPTWLAGSILDRAAQAEYGAVARGRFISEEQIAGSFNQFVQQIGAPAWAQVSPVEIRNIRDAELASAKRSWNSGQRTIWGMPDIYHVDPEGKAASGCRAVEAMKLLYNLDAQFANVIYARERIEHPRPTEEASAQRFVEARLMLAQGHTYEQELRQIEADYTKKHGTSAYQKLMRQMFERLLP